jgi:hypothetical protein
MGLFGVSAMLSTVGSMNQSFGEATSGLNNFVFALSSAMMVLELVGSMKGMMGGVKAAGAVGEAAGVAGTASKASGLMGLLGRLGPMAPLMTNPWVLGGVAAAAAVAGIAFAIYKVKQAEEEARKSSVSMFKQPIETAKVYGKQLRSIADTLKEVRQTSLTFSEDQKDIMAVDPAVLEAVKKDYEDFIERLKDQGISTAGYELALAFNDMLMKGLDESQAKAAIMAIAQEAGKSAAVGFMKNASLGNDPTSAIDAQLKNISSEGTDAAITSEERRIKDLADQRLTLDKEVSNLQKEYADLRYQQDVQLVRLTEDQINRMNDIVTQVKKISGQDLVSGGVDFVNSNDIKNLTTEIDNAKNSLAGLYDRAGKFNSTTIASFTESLFQVDDKYMGKIISAFEELRTKTKDAADVDLGPLKQQLIGMYPELEANINQVDTLNNLLLLLEASRIGVDITVALKSDDMDLVAKLLNLQRDFNAANDAYTTKLKINENAINRNLQTELESANKKVRSIEKVSKAQVKAFDDRTKQMEEGFAQEQDASQERVDAYNEEKDLISKSADTYVKSLERKSAAESFYRKQTKTGLDAIQKLASGDVFGFLEARDQMGADAATRAYDQTIQNVNDRKDAELGVVDEKIKAEQDFQKEQQKTHDAAMANREIERGKLERHHRELTRDIKGYAKELQEVLNLPVKSVGDLETKTKDFAELAPKDVYPIDAYKEHADKLKMLLYYTELLQTKNAIEAYSNVYGPENLIQGAMGPQAPLFEKVGTELTRLPTMTAPPSGFDRPAPVSAGGFTGTGSGGLVTVTNINGEDLPPTGSDGQIAQYREGSRIVHEWQWVGGLNGGWRPQYNRGGAIEASSFRRRNGFIAGAGGPREDRVPAMLSNGEYVVKASSVAKYGRNKLEQINQGVLHLAEGGDGETKIPDIYSTSPKLFTTTLSDKLSGQTANSTGQMSPSTSVQPLDPNAVGSSTDVVGWLRAGGWPEQFIRVGYAIAMRESGGAPGAISTGDWGLFQLNKPTYGNNGWWNDTSMLDPIYNARMAWQYVAQQGGNFLPWGMRVDPNGSFQFDWSYYKNADGSWVDGFDQASADYVESYTPAYYESFPGFMGGGYVSQGKIPHYRDGTPPSFSQGVKNVMGMENSDFLRRTPQVNMSAYANMMAQAKQVGAFTPSMYEKFAAMPQDEQLNLRTFGTPANFQFSTTPAEFGGYDLGGKYGSNLLAAAQLHNPVTSMGYAGSAAKMMGEALWSLVSSQDARAAMFTGMQEQGLAKSAAMMIPFVGTSQIDRSTAEGQAMAELSSLGDILSVIPGIGTASKVISAAGAAGRLGLGAGLRSGLSSAFKAAAGTYGKQGQIPQMFKMPFQAARGAATGLGAGFRKITQPRTTVYAAGPAPDEGLLVSRIVRRYVEDAPEDIPFEVISPSGAIITVVKRREGPTNYGLYSVHHYGFDPLPRGRRRGQSPTGTAIPMYGNDPIEMLVPSTLVNEAEAITAALPKYMEDLAFRQTMEGAGAVSPRQIDFSNIVDETVGRITDLEKRSILEREMGSFKWNRGGSSNWRQLWEERSARQNPNENMPPISRNSPASSQQQFNFNDYLEEVLSRTAKENVSTKPLSGIDIVTGNNISPEIIKYFLENFVYKGKTKSTLEETAKRVGQNKRTSVLGLEEITFAYEQIKPIIDKLGGGEGPFDLGQMLKILNETDSPSNPLIESLLRFSSDENGLVASQKIRNTIGHLGAGGFTAGMSSIKGGDITSVRGGLLDNLFTLAHESGHSIDDLLGATGPMKGIKYTKMFEGLSNFFAGRFKKMAPALDRNINSKGTNSTSRAYQEEAMLKEVLADANAHRATRELANNLMLSGPERNLIARDFSIYGLGTKGGSTGTDSIFARKLYVKEMIKLIEGKGKYAKGKYG